MSENIKSQFIRLQLKDIIGWLTLGFVGAILIALSLPSLAAHYYLLPISEVIRQIDNDGSDVPSQKLVNAEYQLERARRLEPQNGSHQSRLTISKFHFYELQLSEKKLSEAKSTLVDIRGVLRSTLRTAPGNSNNWYLLSEIATRLESENINILDFLNMSYLTGPRESWVGYRRLGLSLHFWEILDQDIQLQVRQEIRAFFWNYRLRLDLVRIFMRSPVLGQKVILQEVRSFGASDLSRFNQALAQQGWKGEISSL